jgi:transcriptional regulator with XRE-family HTH domain
MMDATLPEIIRMERARQRMSQSALAKAAGCSRNYISLIERGEAKPTLDILAKVAHALGLEITFSLRKQAALDADSSPP